MSPYPTLPDSFGKRPGIKRGKYNAQPTVFDGVRFDSKGEARRFAELQLLERTGRIRKLRRQVSFPLQFDGIQVLMRSPRYPNGRVCKYTADFVYVENEVEVIEDFKGHQSAESKLRIAVFEAIYKTRVRISRAA